MKGRVLIWILVVFVWGYPGTCGWAFDTGWMQKGVRIWYYGGAGTSNATEAYLIDAVEGNDVQLTKHAASIHWTMPQPAETQTHPLTGMGPCWIHPQRLQSITTGDHWMGLEITFVTRSDYTYDSFPYRLLPAKALFDLKSQREIVKLTYMIPNHSTGYAYFDAETGLCLFQMKSSGFVLIYLILSEINYDFDGKIAFTEDDGPHTGFRSRACEVSLGDPMFTGGGSLDIQSHVETRYGDSVETYVSSANSGNISMKQGYENYIFFGHIPEVRYMDFTDAPNHPPESWYLHGEYLWWWLPQDALQKNTINLFGVPMARVSTNPYNFTALEEPGGLFFPSAAFDSDGYLIEFSAKDSETGLDISPGDYAFENLTTVDGLDYYRNYMGTATPDTAAGGTNGGTNNGGGGGGGGCFIKTIVSGAF